MFGKIWKKIDDFMSKPFPEEKEGLLTILSIIFPVFYIPFLFCLGIFLIFAWPYWMIKDLANWIYDHFRPESDFEYVDEYEDD